jgi:hypothetical protein
MKKILLVLVFILTFISHSYSNEKMTVNSLIKEGYKITKEELVKSGNSGALKILTLKKGNSSIAICMIEISGYGFEGVQCIKP